MLPLNAHTRTTVLGVAAVTALYLATAWAIGVGVVDDSYIFLRYARNIWEGAGAVFNDGERVEGYTSPLWLAVLTGLWRLPIDPPAVAVAASATVGYVTLLFLVLWRPRALHSGLLGALFLASNPSFVFWAWSGMDTALYALLVALCVLLFERDLGLGRLPLGTGIALALAAGARLEAIWLVPLLAAFILRDRSKGRTSRLLALCLPLGMVLGVHALWRHSYYGTWLPNTFASKVGVPKGPLALKGLVYVATAAVAYAPLLVVMAVAIRSRSSSRVRTTNISSGNPFQGLNPGRSLLIPGSCAAWIVVYATLVGGDHFALFRFLVPALALAAMLAGRLAVAHAGPQEGPRKRVAIIAVLLAVNGFVVAGPQTAAARSEVGQAKAWANTGRWCAARLPPGSIASMVVGAIPYYCDRETVDLLGLVDPHIARFGKVHIAAPAGHQKYDTDYVLRRAPDFIFFLSSGMPFQPLFRTVEDRIRWLDDKGFALEDLVTDPRTLDGYVYRAEQLEDGRWVELLEKRPRSRGSKLSSGNHVEDREPRRGRIIDRP